MEWFSKNKRSNTTTRNERAVDQAMLSLSNWRELTIIDQSAAKPSVIARIPTLHFGLIIFIVAAILTIYIGQVHRSQDLLGEINTERRENIRLHLLHNRLAADLNATIGPSVIHSRGTSLGLKGIDQLTANHQGSQIQSVP